MNELLLRLTATMPMKQINICNTKGWDHDPVSSSNSLPAECVVTSSPYLQRYFAGTFRDGSDLWLHRFLSADGDRHLHSHPFEFVSVMLCGGYTEEFISSYGAKDYRNTAPRLNSQLPELLEKFLIKLNSDFPPLSYTFLSLAHGESQALDVYDWHRIASVQPETWTAVIVEPKRLPKWFFKDDNGQLSDMVGSPRDWWKDYRVRPDGGIAGDDNRI